MNEHSVRRRLMGPVGGVLAGLAFLVLGLGLVADSALTAPSATSNLPVVFKQNPLPGTPVTGSAPVTGDFTVVDVPGVGAVQTNAPGSSGTVTATFVPGVGAGSESVQALASWDLAMTNPGPGQGQSGAITTCFTYTKAQADAAGGSEFLQIFYVNADGVLSDATFLVVPGQACNGLTTDGGQLWAVFPVAQPQAPFGPPLAGTASVQNTTPYKFTVGRSSPWLMTGAARVGQTINQGKTTGVWTAEMTPNQRTLLNTLAGSTDSTQGSVGWARVTLDWRAVETAQGTFDWTQLDALLQRVSNGGSRQVLVKLRGNPDWLTNVEPGFITQAMAPTSTPEQWAAQSSPCAVRSAAVRTRLADFMTAVVNRYKPGGTVPVNVRYWQLYNEAENTDLRFDTQNNLGGCFGTASLVGNVWTPSDQGRQDYAEMLKVVGPAIKAADPDAKVVHAGLVSGNYISSQNPACTNRALGSDVCLFDRWFLQGVLTHLGTQHTVLDWVAVHWFSSLSSQEAATIPKVGLDTNRSFEYANTAWSAWGGVDLVGRVSRLRQDMVDAGLTATTLKPVVVDEISYTGQFGNACNPRSNPPGCTNEVFEQWQEGYVLKTLVRGYALDIVSNIWFQLQDQAPNTGLGSDVPYGLYRENGTLKDSGVALQQFHQILPTTTFQQRRGAVYITSSGNDAIQVYTFQSPQAHCDGAARVSVMWNQMAEAGDPAAVNTRTINSGDMSLFFGISGVTKVMTAISTADRPDLRPGGGVTVGPAPIYVCHS